MSRERAQHSRDLADTITRKETIDMTTHQHTTTTARGAE